MLPGQTTVLAVPITCASAACRDCASRLGVVPDTGPPGSWFGPQVATASVLGSAGSRGVQAFGGYPVGSTLVRSEGAGGAGVLVVGPLATAGLSSRVGNVSQASTTAT